MWDMLILNPMINLMIWLYGLLGNNIFLAIISLTILIYLITVPLTIQQQRAMAKTQEMQPQINAVRAKYKDDPQKMQEEFAKLGINPLAGLGGCLPLLIQMPILFGMYQAISQSLAASPIQLLNLSQHIYQPVPEFLRWLPNAPALIPLNSRFLWLDLAAPDPLFILPALVVISTFLSNKMMTPPPAPAAAADDPAVQQQAMMSRQMQLMMPIIVGWASLTFPAGLSVYWVTSNIVRFVQYLLMGKASLKNLFGTPDGSFSLSGLLGLPSAPPPETKSSRGKGSNTTSGSTHKVTAGSSKSAKKK